MVGCLVGVSSQSKQSTISVKRTLSQEVLQVLDRGLFDFVIRRISADERKHIVCQDIRIGV